MWRPLIVSLFLETEYNIEEAIYTLKDIDYEYKGKHFYSLRRLYMETADPTEYEFAERYFVNFKHWQRVSRHHKLKKHVEEWREELEIKFRSMAVKEIIKSSKKGSYQASRWLVDKGWEPETKGRPRKEDIQQRIQQAIREDSEYDDDVKRVKG